MQYYDKRKLRLYTLALICLLFSIKLSAQSGSLSLKDALTAADKNYPSIKAKMNYIKAAEQNIKEARREYIPSLSVGEQLSYATANSLPGTYFSYGLSTSGDINAKNLDNPNFGMVSGIYSQWPVFAFGQNQAKINLAQNQEKLAESELKNEKFVLAAKTAQAFFDLATMINLRQSQEKNLLRAESMRNMIKPLVVNGLRPGVDSTTANAEVSKAKMGLYDAQNNETMQRNYLAMLIGSTDTNLVPDTGFFLKLPPQAVADGSTSANPMMAYYMQQENVNNARELVIRRGYLPRISLLGAAWGRGSGISPVAPNTVDPSFGDGTSLTRFNYALGLEATFNITDYPRMMAQANTLKYETAGMHEETNEQELILQNQLKDADNNYASAYKKAQESPVLVNAAQTAYTQKLAMYNSGLTNFTDLAQALYNLNDAEVQNAVSYDNVWKALLYKAVPAGDINILLRHL